MVRKIVASKVQVHAKDIKVKDVVRQTGTHHASRFSARKDVVLEIKEQYPRQKDDSQRPPAGTRIYGDSADVSARKIIGPRFGRVHKDRYSVTAEDNVVAVIKDSKKEAKK